MDVRDIAPIAILFVAAGITLSIGAYITQTVQNSMAADTVANYAARNATAGIGTIAQWLPTIGLVIAAAIIIGVIFFAMMGRSAT